MSHILHITLIFLGILVIACTLQVIIALLCEKYVKNNDDHEFIEVIVNTVIIAVISTILYFQIY